MPLFYEAMAILAVTVALSLGVALFALALRFVRGDGEKKSP